jgi:putative hemolysin
MSDFSPTIILLVLFFIVVEGFFSGSELALLSADKLALKKKSKVGDFGAGLALRLLKNPERVLSSTLILTNTCVMTISVLLTLEFKRIKGPDGELYAVVVGSLLVILFGELIPKFVFRKLSATVAPKVAIPIFYTQKILSPVIGLISFYTSQITKVLRPIELMLVGKKQTPKDELQGLLTTDSNDTQIKSNEKRLIKKILKFREKLSKDGLVPLVQVDAIERQATLQEAFELFAEKKHSRLPVYDERIDNIIGVLELSQVLRQTDLKQKIDRFIKPAVYTSEAQRLEETLNDMMDQDFQIAIVVDEYGGAVGILTREDIFEQIVGDLEDEDDAEKKLIRTVSPHQWLVKSRTTITQINEELQIDLPEGDYDTLSGFLLRQFSRIPESGDELYFDTKAGQIHFIVREATRRRIESVSIERILGEV